MKKYLIVLLISLPSTVTHARHITKTPIDAEHFDQHFEEMIETTDQETDWDPHHTRCGETPSTAIATIIAFNGLDLLRENFYIRTNPINKRPLIDLPEFTLHIHTPHCDDALWHFKTDLFFNKTDQAYFTQESTFIRSYLGFDNKNLIQLTEDLELTDVDIPKVLALFANAKIEERRVGLMFDGYKVRNGWLYEARMPVLYQERNFFLNAQEEKAIRNSKFFKSDENAEIEFARKHLITDRIGLGDTRINIGYTFCDNDSLWLNSGLHLTLPTGRIFTAYRGYYGSHFDRSAGQPTFNIVEFLNVAVPGTPCSNPHVAQQEGQAFLEGALNRLSAMVLEDDLGNNGHVGIGLYEEHHLQVNEKLSFRARSWLEYLVPNWEPRFYIQNKDQAAFDKVLYDYDTDPNNQVVAAQNLAFLEQQLVETFYPASYRTFISPGFIFNFTGAVTGNIKETWQTSLGYDLWVQTQEHRGDIKVSDYIKPILKTEIARKPSAFQNKLFFIANYYRKHESNDWNISLAADYTFFSSGIGQDYTIALGYTMLL